VRGLDFRRKPIAGGHDGPAVLLSAGWSDTGVGDVARTGCRVLGARSLVVIGARNRDDHPFFQESRRLLQGLQYGRSYIRYSRPGPQDQLGSDFDAPGHLDVAALEQLGVPPDADFYLCGPPTFLRDLTTGLSAWGVSANRVRTEVFGPGESMTPGVAAVASRPPLCPVPADASIFCLPQSRPPARHRYMSRAARIRPTPRLRTAAARKSAPMFARFIKPESRSRG